MGLELGVDALVLRVYWRIGGGGSVGKWDMNDLCGIRGLVGRGGVLFGRWGGNSGMRGGSSGKIFCGGVKEDSYKIMLFRGIVVHLWLFLPEDETWIDLIALISRSLMRS